MPRRDRVALFSCLLMLVFPLIVGWLDPHVAHSQSLCPFKLLTGFPCPGCGITKSLIYLYRGEVSASLSAHVFGIPALALASGYPLYLLAGKPLTLPVSFGVKAGYLAAGLLAVYHAIRLVHFVATHTVQDILRESVWQ